MRIAEKHKIHPVVVECIDRSWHEIQNYEICKQVLTGAGLSDDEKSFLLKELRNE